MDLFLVRHGQTEWSAQGRHTGRTDVPLTDLGRTQVRALRPSVEEYLDGRRFERVISSPRQRATETARILLGDVPAEADQRAQELDYGEYEGLTRQQITDRDPEWTVWDRPCPGGETMTEAEARADALLQDLAPCEPVAVVAHGHFCRILAARALGMPGWAGRLFAASTASLSVIRDHGGERCVFAWNVTPTGDPAPSDGWQGA